MKRILSIDGGGIRGLIPATVLAALEQVAARPCGDLFDLIAGTSTGGIIALGLAHGLAASDMVDLYAKKGPAIFSRSFDQELRSGDGVYGPRYLATSLEKVLLDLLGDATLADVRGPELLIPAYAIDVPSAWFFRTWKARSDATDNLHLRDVARATSAAPTYFPPAMVGGHAFIDGGMFANNPAMCALASARKLWPGQPVEMLSLGTGSFEEPLDPKDAAGWGEVGWIKEIVAILMDGAADAVAYQTDAELGSATLRIAPALSGANAPSVDMDDVGTENLLRLAALGKASASAVTEALARFAKRA